MGATFADVLPHLREHYADKIVDIWMEVDKKLSPTLAGMELRGMAMEGLGRKFVVPFTTSTGSSISATFAEAQAISNSTNRGSRVSRGRWEVDAATIDATARWERSTILAAQGDSEKLFDVMDQEWKSRIAGMKRRLAIYAIEEGFGKVATITAAPTATTVTVSVHLVNRIQVGDHLVASASVGANVLKNGAAQIALAVAGIDPDTGVLTMEAPASGVTGGAASGDPTVLNWALNDVLFWLGDRENSATPTKLVPTGNFGWVPISAPGATTFFGVNRQNNIETGGHRVNCAGKDHFASLLAMAKRALSFGIMPSECRISPADFEILAADKDAAKIMEIGVGKLSVGFEGASVRFPGVGSIKVLPDIFYPQGTAWMGPYDDAEFAPFVAYNNNELISVDEEDGNTITRISNATAYEMRLYSRLAIVYPAPGKFIAGFNLPSS